MASEAEILFEIALATMFAPPALTLLVWLALKLKNRSVFGLSRWALRP